VHHYSFICVERSIARGVARTACVCRCTSRQQQSQVRRLHYIQMIMYFHTHMCFAFIQRIARGIARTARVCRCTSRQQQPQVRGLHYIHFYIFTHTWLHVYTHMFTHVNNVLREALRALRAFAGAHRASSTLRCQGLIIYIYTSIFTQTHVLHMYTTHCARRCARCTRL